MLFMKPDQHEFHGFLHSADLIEADLRARLAPLRILPRQAQVLEAMARMGAVSQAELAMTFGVTPASMSTMTDRLIAAGYITSTVDPTSRRRHVLELTGQGRALVAGILKVWDELDEALATILGSDAAQFFLSGRRLRAGLGGKVPGGSQGKPDAKDV
jgi:DNA-binding MarR family transcriptional regulator